jgi:hypothetical protein
MRLNEIKAFDQAGVVRRAEQVLRAALPADRWTVEVEGNGITCMHPAFRVWVQIALGDHGFVCTTGIHDVMESKVPAGVMRLHDVSTSDAFNLNDDAAFDYLDASVRLMAQQADNAFLDEKGTVEAKKQAEEFKRQMDALLPALERLGYEGEVKETSWATTIYSSERSVALQVHVNIEDDDERGIAFRRISNLLDARLPAFDCSLASRRIMIEPDGIAVFRSSVYGSNMTDETKIKAGMIVLLYPHVVDYIRRHAK